MDQIKWIFANMKGSRWKFFSGIIIHNAICLPLVIIGPMIVTAFVDQVFTNGILDNVYYLLGLYLLVSLLRAIFQYAYSYLLDWAGSDVLANFRTTLYKKLQILTPSFYSATRTGDIMMRLTGDLETMRHFVAWVMSNAVYAVIIFIAGLVVFFSTNAILASILLVVSPFMAFLIIRMRKISAPMYGHLREMNSHLNAMVQENIAGNRVVKAFVREKFEQEKFEKLNENYKTAAVDAAGVWARFGPIFNALSNGVMISVLVVGGIMVINGSLTLGQLLLFYNLNWLINESMRLVGVVINDGQRFFSSTHKVMQLFYARTDVKNNDHPYFIEDDTGAQNKVGQVIFQNVGFRYDTSDVLRNINITAEPGQTIGIMGPTGSGKSTLAMLMGRFADVTSGSIQISGTDVRDYDLHDLRRQIGISMQDVFLFSNTIDANIAYGRPDMDPQQVVDYAKMADADGFIRRMPDGYDTIVGERGVGLSGGQKQRIALARALAFETPIVILDDTTSAVDMETEKYIQQQLAARQGRYTTFIIAQRISSVKNADKIYIIEHGEVVESGTHYELLEKKGYYYDIYCLQQGIVNTASEADRIEKEVGLYE